MSKKQTKCPFSVGDKVTFTPSQRTLGLYQNIECCGVRVGETRIVREVREDTYIYFEDGTGGWPWTEFTKAE
jgi:hypothetical protein